MPNYILSRTDPNNKSIVLQPYTVNGPQTPSSTKLYNNSLTGINAVTENSSLVLSGKGVPEYGELVQNNLVYLTENFASPTRPRNPLQGQIWYKNTSFIDPAYQADPALAGLYVWTGQSWLSVVLNAVGTGGNLNLAGTLITNLGNPVQPTDALNLRTGDARYMPAGGGTIKGDITIDGGLTINLPINALSSLTVTGNQTVIGNTRIGGNFAVTGNVTGTLSSSGTIAATNVTVSGTLLIATSPTLPAHAATKAYVDQAVAGITGGSTGSTATGSYLPLGGGTVTGTVSINAPSSTAVTSLILGPTVSLQLQTGNGAVFFGNRVITSVGVPTSSTDAATKGYVDTALASSTSSGITVRSGNFSAGVLSLTMTNNAVVTVTGSVADRVHSHNISELTYNTANIGQSLINAKLHDQSALTFDLSSITSTSADNVLRIIDRALYSARAPLQRQIITATSSALNTYILPPNLEYTVGYGKVSVFVNGLKYVASERGTSRVTMTASNIGERSNPGLAAGTYPLTVRTNGGTAFVVSTVVPSGGYTYRQLVNSLNYIFQGQPVAASPATSGQVNYAWTNLVSSGATGLANNSTAYTATIVIDGVTKNVSIAGSAAQTFGDLVAALSNQLLPAGSAFISSSTNLRIISSTTGTSSTVAVTGGNLFTSLTGRGTATTTPGAAAITAGPTSTVRDVTARIEQNATNLVIVFESTLQGTGSAVTVSYLAGELLKSISISTAPVETAVTANRNYEEVGAVGAQSTSIKFLTQPTTGQVVEIIVQP